MVRPQFVVVLSLIVLCAMPAAVAALIVVYGVDVPYWDQLETGRFLVRNHAQVFPSVRDLIAQHNESRIVLPRLIMFYLARASGWNVKWEMATSLILAAVTTMIIAILARRDLGPVGAVGSAACAALLVFSLVQWWDWLVGFQMVMFLPPLFLGAALVLLTRNRLGGAVVAAVCATFSFVNGLFVWIALLPAVAATGTSPRRRVVNAAIWCAAAAGVFAAYFFRYERPAGVPRMSLPHEAPLRFVAYCLAFLGHPVAPSRDLAVSVAAGAVLCAAFAAASFIAWRERRHGAIVWTPFALYAALSAMAAAGGRMKFALEQALEPRYATISCYFALAVILLVVTLGRPWMTALGVTLLVASQLLAVRSEWQHMRLFSRERLAARAACDFALVTADTATLHALLAPAEWNPRETIRELASIGYADPLTSNLIRDIDSRERQWFGQFSGAVRTRGGSGVFGWASLPGPRPADAVLLTSISPAGEHVVAVARYAWLDRPAIGAAEPALRRSGWQHLLAPQSLPAGSTLRAWAYDTRARAAYPLEGAVIVEP